MIFALPLLFVGALTFVEQDIDRVTDVSSYIYWQYRRADVDGDGRMDLVLSTQVCFQRDGTFPLEARAPIPGAKEKANVDCFGGALYVRFEDRLALYQWENGDWKVLHEQAIGWPSPAADGGYYQPDDRKLEFVRFESFLADLDADGVPEIVLPGQEDLYVYRRSESGYAEAARLDVFPRPKSYTGDRSLWRPRGSMRLSFPYRSSNYSYVIDGNRLTVITSEPSTDIEMTNRYRVKRYRIDANDIVVNDVVGPGFTAVPEAGGEEVSEPLPIRLNQQQYNSCMLPRRLNDEAPMDYARSMCTNSDTSAFPIPINETVATTDGGKTIQVFRTQHGWVPDPFVDVNGDGRVDIVTWTTDMFDSGLRETVNRFLSGKKFVEEAHVHFQNAQGIFSKTPDVIGRFTIKMSKPMCRGVYPRCGNINGDFNGDGRHDVLIEYKPLQIAVYLCEGRVFAAKPAGVAKIPEHATYEVDDFDGDGRADILVKYWKRDGETMTWYRRVYLTREMSK